MWRFPKCKKIIQANYNYAWTETYETPNNLSKQRVIIRIQKRKENFFP